MKKLLGFSLCLLFLCLTSCNKLYVDKASSYYVEGNYQESLDYLNKIPKKNTNYNTFVLKGNNYYALGNTQKAFENYKIAYALNSNIIIRPLISIYFYNEDITKALYLIHQLEDSGTLLTKEERKIEYVCLYRLDDKISANKVLNEYLSDLDNFEITKLKILTFDNTSTIISQTILELCEINEYKKAEELLDMSYSYGNFNSGFLSVLSYIIENENIDSEFRAKAAYYSSIIFKSINNIKQSSYYSDYYYKLSQGLQIIFPKQLMKI
ncbi:MAG: hypothetical protein JJE21_05855 [Spirochaetaceae bacterium]|nr:hypothetical protein [Spirochaetaceae bacterium]